MLGVWGILYVVSGPGHTVLRGNVLRSRQGAPSDFSVVLTKLLTHYPSQWYGTSWLEQHCRVFLPVLAICKLRDQKRNIYSTHPVFTHHIVTMLYVVHFRLTFRIVHANLPYFSHNLPKYVSTYCRWVTFAESFVDLSCSLPEWQLSTPLSTYLTEMGYILFVIFLPNVAINTRPSLGSHLFCLGKNTGLLPEVATFICYLGISYVKCSTEGQQNPHWNHSIVSGSENYFYAVLNSKQWWKYHNQTDPLQVPL